MGAWGYGIFENDETMDWTAELVNEKGIEFLQNTITQVLAEEYIELEAASSALGAIEVWAALHGKLSHELKAEFEHNEDLEKWIKEHSRAGIHMKDLAKQAVKRILEESELKELWEESGEYQKWERTIKDLENRIEELK